MPTRKVSCGRKPAQRQAREFQRSLLPSVSDVQKFSKRASKFLPIAKKLPLTAPPSARAGGPGRTGPARAGVDLNKQSAAQGQQEACNC